MADNHDEKVTTAAIDSYSSSTETPPDTGLVNVSGHKQELERNFGLISLCGLGITSGNTWIALGGAVVRFFEQVARAIMTEYPCRQSQYTMVVYLASFMSSSQLHFSTGLSQPPSLSSRQPYQQRVEVRSCESLAEGKTAEFWNSIPLGDNYCWPIWTIMWMVCRLVELLGMALWTLLNRSDCCRSSSVDVCNSAPDIRH